MDSMKRVLVTGAGGYVGTILVPRLIKAGYEVIALDSFVFSDPPEVDAAVHSLRVVQSDIRHIDREVLQGVDALIHLAAFSNDPSCDLDAKSTQEVNEDATIALAHLAKECGVKRFVFASSCSVYGATGGEPSTEQSELQPVSLYAHCKARAEQALRALADDDFCPTFLRKATLSAPNSICGRESMRL